MNLYLLRHGIAAEPGTAGITRDADRPLTADGEKKVGKIARAMKAMELSFDAIVSSRTCEPGKPLSSSPSHWV